MTKFVYAVLLVAVSTLLSGGAALAAPCAGFTDVDDTVVSGEQCQSVEWLKNREITTGCTSSTLYCPNNPVLRSSMALFLSRMGDRLTPVRYFVDLNPGPVNIQASADNYVCASPAHTPAYPQKAALHGLVFGLVNAAVVWSADLWFSTDFGATWNFASNYIPMIGAATAGGTQGNTFAHVDLAVGMPYIFAIRVRESPDATAGSGNFLDLGCHLMVEINNRTSFFSPFDAAAASPAGGSLTSNR